MPRHAPTARSVLPLLVVLVGLGVLVGRPGAAGATQHTFSGPMMNGYPIGTKYPATGSSSPEDTARRFCEEHDYTSAAVLLTSVRGVAYSFVSGSNGVGPWSVTGNSGVTVIELLACGRDEVVYTGPRMSGYAVGTRQPATGAGSSPADTAHRFCRDLGHLGARTFTTSLQALAYSFLTAAGGLGAWSVTGNAGVTVLDAITCATATAISTGGYHSCAIRGDGSLWCWGYNAYGQLGDGTVTSRAAPVAALGGGPRIAAVSAGHAHTCAILDGGAVVRCWGYNAHGQLGDGTVVSRPTPVSVAGLGGSAVAIAAGYESTCALTALGGVKCWGNNAHGQLGDGTTYHRASPVDVYGLTSGVRRITVGHGFACALTTAGAVKCWGDNRNGQLGAGTATQYPKPIEVTSLGTGNLSVAAGSESACALTGARGVKCWGANLYGEVGDGTLLPRPTPVDVSGLTSGVREVTAGNNAACALTTAGGVTCWGFNGSNNLGDNSRIPRPTPVDVYGLASGVTTLGETNGNHTCVRLGTGRLSCWGNNTNGELGNGLTTPSLIPVLVQGP